MTHARSMPKYTHTFDAIDPTMPGTFVLHTDSGTVYVILHGPGGESLACRFPSPEALATPEYDGKWIAVLYDEIQVGERTAFFFADSEMHRRDKSFYRVTHPVVRIGLYEGSPELPPLDFDPAAMAAYINATQANTVRGLKDL